MDSTPRYRVVRRLGVGGMAEVFLARDAQGGRWVALKRLLTDDVEHLDLFLDEARLAAQLVHPSIARVYELGCDGDGLFIALEYVDGASLAAILARTRRGERLARELGLYIAAELVHALDHVHHAVGADGAPLAIVHRDVNPGNVLVSRTGEVKLTDFGIAKARAGVHRTRTGVVRGTSGYMSPEQLGGAPVAAASDVWSAAVVLCEAVPALGSADLERVVRAALDPDPARRPDAGALAQAIDRELGDREAVRARLGALVTAWFGASEAPACDADAVTRVERRATWRR